MEVNSDKSVVFNYIKFILILGVVAIHSSIYAHCDIPANPIGRGIVLFFANGLTKVCVPCFFLLSGYLYFNNVDRFTRVTYLSKTRRRIYSLLIPYLLWNVIGLGIALLKYRFFNYPSFGVVEEGHLYIPRLVEGFWDYANGYPYAFAFWFIRNLIIFVVLSPLAYLIGGRNVYIFGAFIVALAAFDISLWGFEYFILGCGIATFFKKQLLEIKRSAAFPTLIIWVGIAAATLWVDFGRFGSLMLMSASVCAFFSLYYIFRQAEPRLDNRFVSTIVASTFFIYAVHQFFVTVTLDFYIGIFNIETAAGGIAAFLLSFLTKVAVSFIVWLIMRRCMPGVTRVLSGGR